MEHLLAVQKVRAGLAQVTQINLRQKTDVELAALHQRSPERRAVCC